PELWALFEGLKPVPVLVLRGANSDILSLETVRRMEALHPKLEVLTVADQGHAPLIEGDLVDRIRRFVVEAEKAGPPQQAERQPAADDGVA
ncbi:MAG TPA: hypothetical protein VHK66_09335, partial [Microvirga sp.]|nr:hypothetical protein [Microvirga sp.]